MWNTCQGENGSKFYWKMRFLVILSIEGELNYLKIGFLKISFEDMHVGMGVRHVGFKNCPPKVAMHDTYP